MDVIFTIVSRNYAAQAATLMQSLQAAEPKARRVVIATDGPIPRLEGLAEVIDAAELDAPFAAMTVYYDALELNTAVKPYAFRRLLGEADSVTYLDPDIYVFRPLEAVRTALAEAELALTPHITRPLTGEAAPDDRTILQSGIYNLGFMAVRRTPKVLALIDWWAERCRFDCRVDFAAGLFTDQRWMDLAPGFVDRLAILRTPTLNLAYWNLEGRTLEKTATGWTVDGQPLGFFHFSGFDPARPQVLSKHQDRIQVAPGSALAGLLQDYARALLANGHAEARAIPYGHDRFASGEPITREMRKAALAAARTGERFADGLGGRVEARLRDGEAVARQADPTIWREPPWRGPAAEALTWLRGETAEGRPRVCAALLAARSDLRGRFIDDQGLLLAWCLGVEAPADRFACDLLPDRVIAGFAEDREPLLAAARFADPGASPVKRRLSMAFGLADRGGWPEPLVRVLRKKLLAPADGQPAPMIELFLEIRRGRPDLQKLFPLETPLQRFRFLRWLVGGGLAEHDVAFEHLPGAVRADPLMRLARLSVRRGPRPPARAAASGRAGELWVVEDAEAAREAASDRLVYEARSGRFLFGGGAAKAPAEVDLVRFLTEPAFVAADAIALHARGVRWRRAAGQWNASAIAALDAEDPALGFVDEIWGAERSDLVRPARSQAMAAV